MCFLYTLLYNMPHIGKRKGKGVFLRKKVEKSTAEGGKTYEKKMPRIGKEAEKGRTGGEKNQRGRLKKVQRETEKNPPNKAAGTGKGAEKKRQKVKKTGITARQN